MENDRQILIENKIFNLFNNIIFIKIWMYELELIIQI